MLVYSFDVFDTCIYRSTVTAESVFYQTGLELSKNKPEIERSFWIEEFVASRINAEKEARLKHPFGEPSIFEIWNCLAELDSNYKREDVFIELKIEKEILRCNSKMLELVRNLQKRNHRVIFISDTYFSSAYLLDVLENFGFNVNITDIYTSCELSKSKFKSDLYSHISTVEKIDFFNWYHYGDNFISDYVNAKKLGINVIHIKDSNLNILETRVLNKLIFNNQAHQFIRFLRDFRLSSGLYSDTAPSKLVFNSLGPMLLAFGHWCLKIATEQKITNLYFCSRDCRLLFEVCRNIKHLYPNIQHVEYLYTSRTATLLAGVKDINKKELSWIFRPWEIPRLDVILNKLGVDIEVIREELELRGLNWDNNTIINREIDINIFWDIVFTEKVRLIITREIERRRKLNIRYFEKIGLIGERSALVDLGWHRTVLSSINNILLGTNKFPIKGLYLGLNTNRIVHKIEGEFSFSMFYKHNKSLGNKTDLIFHNRETLLEHVLGICDHGTVLGYNELENGDITIKMQPISDMDIERFNEIRNSLNEFSIFSANCSLELEYLTAQSFKHLFNCFFDEFINYQDAKEIKYISNINFSVYQDNYENNRLLSPLSIIDLLRYKLGKSKKLDDSIIYWPEGKIKISNKLVQIVWKMNFSRFRKLLFK